MREIVTYVLKNKDGYAYEALTENNQQVGMACEVTGPNDEHRLMYFSSVSGKVYSTDGLHIEEVSPDASVQAIRNGVELAVEAKVGVGKRIPHMCLCSSLVLQDVARFDLDITDAMRLLKNIQDTRDEMEEFHERFGGDPREFSKDIDCAMEYEALEEMVKSTAKEITAIIAKNAFFNFNLRPDQTLEMFYEVLGLEDEIYEVIEEGLFDAMRGLGGSASIPFDVVIGDTSRMSEEERKTSPCWEDDASANDDVDDPFRVSGRAQC